MRRFINSTLTRALAGSPRKKALTYSICLLVAAFTFLFFSSLIRTVEQILLSLKLRNLRECRLLENITLRGPIEADTNSVPSMRVLERTLSSRLKVGGWYKPNTCRAKHKVAVIVPHREREIHLKLFLRHMHPFLQRQDIEYVIVVVEQAPGSRFNRALLMNVGYVEVSKRYKFDCFIFHDVDLLPLDDRIFYICHDQPLHLSMLVDTLGNSLLYNTLFGGAVALTPAMFEKVNGFSNLFFGWGGEDDDMSYRLRSRGMYIQRYSKEVARYTMMKHAKEDSEQGVITRKLEAGKERIREEGLNSLEYRLLSIQRLPLFTWILVDVNENTILEKFGLENIKQDRSQDREIEIIGEK